MIIGLIGINDYMRIENMTNECNDKPFMTVTNKDIYCKLLEIEKHVMTTNGKVKLSMWVATTALSLVVIVIGILVKRV